jgi:hypothetical protein
VEQVLLALLVQLGQQEEQVFKVELGQLVLLVLPVQQGVLGQQEQLAGLELRVQQVAQG